MKSLKTLMYNGTNIFLPFVHNSLLHLCALAASPLNYGYSTWKLQLYKSVTLEASCLSYLSFL